MDAYLQLLLTVTWQHEQGDGLERLVELAELVRQKVDACADTFESDTERALATNQILDSLQDAKRPSAPTRHRHSLGDWTSTPAGTDLPRLHRETEAPYWVVKPLVTEAKRDVEARVPRRNLSTRVSGTIHAIGKKEGFPFYVPALSACIVDLASRPGRISDNEIHTEVARYQEVAERLAANTKLIARSQIVAELQPTAEQIHLQIDQCYSWADLARYAAKETSLKALGLYTQLNFYGLVKDGHFSPEAVKTKLMPTAEFHRHFNLWFVRGMTLLLSGDDRETRIMRRSIVDAERADVRVYGKRVQDSLVLLVPCDDEAFDIERQLALLLLRLNSVRRKHNVAPDRPAEFFERLPQSLHQLVADHGIRRKVIGTKKTLLFCLAGLIAENVYKYRGRHDTVLANGRRLKTREDADMYVAGLLKQHGFQYSAETLRKGRARFRREFLDRVPVIFGLDEPVHYENPDR
ncbi:hypothetical protein [Burkholderia pseudomallei]|uniref:hypothetical protein n=1 Tax=Burkholderia pseudomallei TaxID=28450 RepID=UPI0011AB50FC|nr:hypothetical protein [Burkholderia pseudomallei]